MKILVRGNSSAEWTKKNIQEMFPLWWRRTSRTQEKAGKPEDATGNHTGKANVGGDD